MIRFVSNSPAQTLEFARSFAKRLCGGEFLAFFGDLGAGKTCFISGLAQGLGCTDPAASPTFAIVNVYRGPRPLCHFDMYRLTGEDLEETGFYDYLDAGLTVACEWCENIADEIPENAVTIRIEKGDCETERVITIEGGGL